jgi:hypothetical protein
MVFLLRGSLQKSSYKANQIFGQFFGRLLSVVRMHYMQLNVVFQDLGHQAIHAATNRGQQHQNVGAFVAAAHSPLDGPDLSRKPLDPRK